MDWLSTNKMIVHSNWEMATAVLGPFYWTTPIIDLFSLHSLFSHYILRDIHLRVVPFSIYIFLHSRTRDYLKIWKQEFLWVSSRGLKWGYWKLESLVFVKGENPGKNPRWKSENQQQTPPSYDLVVWQQEANPVIFLVSYINVFFSHSTRSIWKSWPNL